MPEVSSASQIPVRGRVVQKTTTTRVLSAEEAQASGPKMLPIWEYFETIKPEDWSEHIGYLYRVQPKIGGQEGYLMKFAEPITVDQVRDRFGGQVFRAILKKGQQRVCDTVFTIEAPPKMQTDQGNYQTAQTQPTNSGGGDIARHAIDVATDPQRAAVSLTQEAARSGFEMLRAQMTAGGQQLTLRDVFELMDRMEAKRATAPSGGSGMPTWLETALVAVVPALIGRILTPENPIETFGKLASALQNIPGFGGKSGGNDWKAAMVEALPRVAQSATEIMGEWRRTAEIAANAQRGALPPAQPAPALTAGSGAPANPNPAAPPAGAPPAAPPSSAPAAPPPDGWLKMKLRDMFIAGRSGEDVGRFLEDIHPAFLEQITSIAPEQLQSYLRMDPDGILSPFADDPRMLPFLKELHTWANDVETQDAAAADAPKPKPN